MFARTMQVAHRMHDGGSMRNESNDDDDYRQTGYVCTRVCLCVCVREGEMPDVCLYVFNFSQNALGNLASSMFRRRLSSAANVPFGDR